MPRRAKKHKTKSDTDTPGRRLPEQLPDPWLFDSEALLRELDRCREAILLIPITPSQAVHFAINNAIDIIWNLQKNIRYLLQLHRDGQNAFAQKAKNLHKATTKTRPTIIHHAGPTGT